MSKLIRTLLLFVVCCCACQLLAQEPTTTQSRRAKTFYQRANLYFKSYDVQSAMFEIDQAIKADENFIEAYIFKAELCNYLGDNEGVVESLLKVKSIDEQFYAYADYNIGIAYFAMGKYSEAKQHFTTFSSNPKSAKLPVDDKIARCDFAMKLVSNPVDYKPISLGENLELPYEQYWPSLSIDAKTLVFTMLLPDSTVFMPDGTVRQQEDFYVTHFVDGKWQDAVPIGAPINTNGNEGAQQISSDGTMLVFTGCNRRDGYGKCDIYFAKKNIYGQWGRPYNAGPNINGPSADKQPCLSPDGRFLFFSSDRKGGKGKMDIWYSERDSNGNWGKAKNLGEPINTHGDDICPFIHPDNKTLYFSSDGHMGLGRKDIFMSRLGDDGKWSEPVNLGYPINTHKDEIGLVVDNSGTTAYFSTNINSATKNIYTFELPEAVRPNPVSYVRGVVSDAKTNRPLFAQVQLLNLNSGDTIMSANSDPESGDFMVSLPVGNQYAMLATSSGYLFNSQHFNLTDIHSAIEPFVVSIKLDKPAIGANTILKNVFFKFDSYELLPQSFVELDRMAAYIKSSAGIKFEIGGHTDNVGEDDYNQKLSENRAHSVYNYLVAKGVDAKQLTFKGYGETMPIGDNSTAEGRELNRRTELKVVATF